MRALVAPPGRTHRYRPRGACAAAWSTRAPELLLSGPAGTGKSRALLEKMHFTCLRTDHVRAVILRKTATSLGSTALVTFREHVAKEAILHGELYFYGGSASEAAQYRYSNGSSITVGGLDKPERIMSSEFDLAYIQEATELNEEDWEFVLTRLRNNRLTYQQLMADCNPSFPTHWLKARSERGDTTMINTKHEDNPTLFNEDGSKTKTGAAYIANLDKLTGVRKLRLRFGIWSAAEGLVFEDFDPEVHVIPRFEIPKEWRRFWSIDFGYTNPFVLQCWAVDNDGRLFLYREIYRSKRLVEDHAKDILAIVRPFGKWIEPRPDRVICDHDAEGRATLERHTGLYTTAAWKAVTEGIQYTNARMQNAGDGRPRIFFLENSVVDVDEDLAEKHKPTSTIQELPGYVWDQSQRIGLKEFPVKENDHGCDASRYMVAYHDIQPKPNVRIFSA